MPRLIRDIAYDISVEWPLPTPDAAVPWVNVLHYYDTINDVYEHFIPARTAIEGFLANSFNWQGEEADRIKGELRQLLLEKNDG
jgi:hypothetical protein